MERINKIVLSLLIITLIPLTLNAQPKKAFGSMGILLETGAPNLGFSFFGTNAKGWGGYGTLSYSIFTGVKEDYVYEDLSVNSFGDPKISEVTTSTILNGGLVKHVYDDIIYLYGGIGYTGYQEYAELDDPTSILGDDNGHYWVETESSNGFNLNFGAVFTLKGQIGLNIGYITNPGALSLGIGYVF